MIQNIVDDCLCWVSFADLWPVRTLSEMTKKCCTLKCCFLVAEGLFSNHFLSEEPQWSVLAQAWSANLMAFCVSYTAKVCLWNPRGCVCVDLCLCRSVWILSATGCCWLLFTDLWDWPLSVSVRYSWSERRAEGTLRPSLPWHMSPFHACQTLTCPVHASHIRWVDLLQVASWTVSL